MVALVNKGEAFPEVPGTLTGDGTSGGSVEAGGFRTLYRHSRLSRDDGNMSRGRVPSSLSRPPQSAERKIHVVKQITGLTLA